MKKINILEITMLMLFITGLSCTATSMVHSKAAQSSFTFKPNIRYTIRLNSNTLAASSQCLSPRLVTLGSKVFIDLNPSTDGASLINLDQVESINADFTSTDICSGSD